MRREFLFAFACACTMVLGGCAALPRVLGGGPSAEEIELGYALEASRGEPYRGNVPELRKLFAAFHDRDADRIAAAGFAKVAQLLRECPPETSLRPDLHVWPSPHGLTAKGQYTCLRGDWRRGVGPVDIASEEEQRSLEVLPFRTADPDRGYSAPDVQYRYAGILNFRDYGHPDNEDVHVFAPREFHTAVLQLASSYRTATTSGIEVTVRRDGERLEYGYSVRSSAHYVARDLDSGLAELAWIADHYVGDENGVATPWEFARFTEDAPYLLAIAYGSLSDAEVIARLRKNGVDVDRASEWVAAIERLARRTGPHAGS